MAGTISFGGIGSGIDVEGLITGLTGVARQPISAESRISGYKSAQSSLSDVGSLLGKLKTALNDLDTAQEVGSFTASTTGTAVAASANGSAAPGAYDVTVTKLAKEQRTYSNPFSAAALNLSGTLSLGVGAGTPAQVSVTTTDTLNSVADKINAAGLRASASVLFDGTDYRLQVRGLDSGSANNLTFGGPGGIGDQLGLLVADNTKQQAQNAVATVDGIPVTSTTNQLTSAIPGVTIALKEENATSKITIATDPEGLSKKLQTVVDSYNAVIQKVHSLAGYGQTKASNPALSANSSLRAVTSRLSATMSQRVGTGKYQTLGSIGLKIANDGTMTLDRTKLNTAVETDRTAVTNVLAGIGTGDGMMDVISKTVDELTNTSKGPLQVAKDGFDARAKALQDRVDKQEARVDRYAEQLRKQFTNMDSTVAAYNAQLSQLSSI